MSRKTRNATVEFKVYVRIFTPIETKECTPEVDHIED
jgi:hypothetical protein